MAGIHCPHCNRLTDFGGEPGRSQSFVCRHCHTAATVELFPAHGRGLQAGRVGVASGADEAACFFHAEKRAEAACDQCGRYLCALCDIHVGERHFCPQCFGGDGRMSAPSGITERNRTMRGRLGFWLALGSLLLGPLAAIGGPIAIYLGIRGLREPPSLIGKRTTALAITAIVIGLLETAVWLVLLIAAISGIWSEISR